MWCQCDQSFVSRELISPLSGVISPSWSADGLQMTWWTISDADPHIPVPVTSPMRNSDQAHFYCLLATSQKLNCQIKSESLWCANWNIWCDNAIFIKQIIGIFELVVTISILDRKEFEFRILNLDTLYWIVPGLAHVLCIPLYMISFCFRSRILLTSFIWKSKRIYNMKILSRERFVGCGDFCCPSNGPSVARGRIKLRLLFEMQIFA